MNKLHIAIGTKNGPRRTLCKKMGRIATGNGALMVGVDTFGKLAESEKCELCTRAAHEKFPEKAAKYGV